MSDSLRSALTTLRKARLTGYASACFCTLALLLLIDGLQMLMRSDFNQVDLVMGEQAPMSGAMPLQAKEYGDIVAIIEGHDELEFIPLMDFKGLWFGAHMWRATLDASAATAPGRAVLTVVDLVPAKSTTGNATIMVQNPTQIYTITVWPSQEALLAAHPSLSRRVTGLSAFLLAVLSLACGIALGAANLFLNLAAHKALAWEGIFPIHGTRQTDTGYQAIFSSGPRSDLRTQRPLSLLTPEGVEQGKGVLIEYTRLKGVALLPLDGAPPRFGWLLLYEPDLHPASEPAPEREKDSPGGRRA